MANHKSNGFELAAREKRATLMADILQARGVDIIVGPTDVKPEVAAEILAALKTAPSAATWTRCIEVMDRRHNLKAVRSGAPLVVSLDRLFAVSKGSMNVCGCCEDEVHTVVLCEQCDHRCCFTCMDNGYLGRPVCKDCLCTTCFGLKADHAAPCQDCAAPSCTRCDCARQLAEYVADERRAEMKDERRE